MQSVAPGFAFGVSLCHQSQSSTIFKFEFFRRNRIIFVGKSVVFYYIEVKDDGRGRNN